MSTDKHINYSSSDTVTDAINTRRSIRAFKPTMPTDDVLKNVLSVAMRAPSGTNIQPWKVYVLKGAVKEGLCDAVCKEFDDPSAKHEIEVQYYPDNWFEPFISRRRKIGWDLYGLLGIGKGEREKTHAQHKRNFVFFDAPVGLMFTIHRDLATGSWLDYGMFLQNIMLLAREAGLHTCPQAAWSDYHLIVKQQLKLDESEVVVCGMSLGYADDSAVVNTLVSERAELAEAVQFLE